MTNGMRVWAAPYFDATRENSYDIQAQLGVKIAGEQKLTPLPHWVVSTATSGKRYALLSLPASDWYIGNIIGQAMEVGHSTNSVHALVDFYYGLGGLINLYWLRTTDGAVMQAGFIDGKAINPKPLVDGVLLNPGDRLDGFYAARDSTYDYLFWNVSRADGRHETWVASAAAGSGRAARPASARQRRLVTLAETRPCARRSPEFRLDRRAPPAPLAGSLPG
jgi:hypothetical protein